MEQKQRPIILEIDEAKKELVECVNRILQTHKLSCYLIEPIFSELYSQIRQVHRMNWCKQENNSLLREDQSKIYSFCYIGLKRRHCFL